MNPARGRPIAQEVERYERTTAPSPSDLVGDQWIVLWTLGAKSGKVRKTPLVRIADGEGRYAVIGSQGGAPTDPQWVHNLRAHPVARLQDGATVHDLAVREAEGDEKATWWARAIEVWPDYDAYQEGDRPADPAVRARARGGVVTPPPHSADPVPGAT